MTKEKLKIYYVYGDLQFYELCSQMGVPPYENDIFFLKSGGMVGGGGAGLTLLRSKGATT